MGKAYRGAEQKEFLPFDIPESPPVEPQVSPIHERVWTENKAKLIERYLYYFVLITKHGTYIDGFAGPQYRDKINSWAAKLVLESEPRRLRHFHLYDIKKDQFEQLEALRDSQPPPNRERKEPKRTINVTRGDFNILVTDLLKSASIRQKEATFCLLDQRTFECHWSTVRALSEYKTSGHKIELFYFLPNSWLDRSIAALRNTNTLRDWWGREDWQELFQIKSAKRVEHFTKRFKEELGYRSVKPWPIFERQDGGGALMYYMIHATDHPEAPKLMSRAYKKAVLPKESQEQLELELQGFN